MNKSQTRAWSCLTQQEQDSLFLQLSQGKSSWEAGEIMKITHYKYLEIKDRAQRFFRLFTYFFDSYTNLFRPDSPTDPRFQDFIYGCIEKRLSRKEATQQVGDSTHIVRSILSNTIIKNMARLKESDNKWDNDLWGLICEFDRWNNFRILPRLIQQPSAFKRRVNKKHKIYIKYTLNRLPQYLHQAIREKYYYKAKPSMPKYWVVLVSEELYQPTGYSVIPIRPKEEIIKELNKSYIYVFPDRKIAEDFGFLVSKFRAKTSNVKLGLSFWPMYIETIKQALNYAEINNIDFSIQQLENAYNEHFSDIQRSKKLTSSSHPIPNSE